MLACAAARPRLAATWLRAIVAAALLVGPALAVRAQPRHDTAAQGQLLVARRGMADPRFRQTVILVLRHDETGSFGLILNRPTELDAADVLPDAEGLVEPHAHAFVGGPVLPKVGLALFRSPARPKGAMHVLDDLFMTMSRDTLRAMRAGAIPHGTLRLYLGHTGWAQGQLDAEIARGDWRVMPADLDAALTKDPSRLWRQLTPDGGDDRDELPDALPGARWTRLESRTLTFALRRDP